MGNTKTNMKRTTKQSQATGRNVAVITRKRPMRMSSDPPSIISIPWNSVTLLLTASITSGTGAGLTFNTLQTILQQQVLGGTAVTVELRLKRVRVWEATPPSVIALNDGGFTMDVYDLFGLANAATPNFLRPIVTKTDLPSRINFAKLSYTYPKDRANLTVNSSVGGKNVIEFRTAQAPTTPYTATLKIYFDVAWRFENAATRRPPPLLLDSGNRFEVYNANRAYNRDENKTEEDQFSSLTESLGDIDLEDFEDSRDTTHHCFDDG
jgi:hypothetical protein